MTLQEFINWLGDRPFYIISFFLLIPFTAFLTGLMGKNEGHLAPWKYLYAVLIYLICIPGIFSFALNIYLFLFERRSIFEWDIYTQIIPVFSMIATLLLIRNNVSFEYIPGFGRLSGLVMMIFTIIAFMWFLDRTHIIIFSYLPISTLLIIFIVFLLLVRFGWSRFFSKA